ncbi:MAG: phenylalanine--tRNA ligase subunit beta [Ignavibacteria bacterium]|nr:phenylalanine--tRNA ligase subunit beta [Ignavibacteria bacterium]
MRISLNWIKTLIPGFKVESYEELFKDMVGIGLDIESIENEREKYENFVIGEVLETEKHPNADKLTLCKVNIGESVLNIVCGAQNVAAGQKVCVAKIGARIPNGGFEIKKSKIRGELSEGMICAEDELGLSEDHSGIMVLNPDAKAGQEFSNYIGADDYFIEIGVTPNRGDLFSQTGMAREIAGIYGLKVRQPEINISESSEYSKDFIDITIENTNYCKRFTGRIIKDVTVKESPEWLKKSLKAVGLRPINNIVDITNYVMMETGQPLHAFDYDRVKGRKIIVRTANEGDKFTTLDSKERILNANSLMVCDGDGPSGIAGIMGGEFSEISGKTKNVLIEVAYFDPVCVRKNSKRLGLQTDASQRFERGVDIANIPYVSDRASSLIQELAGGKVLKGIVDVYPHKFEKLTVGMRSEWAEKVIGIRISKEKIISLLESIEINFSGEKDGYLHFDIPEYRREDIQREIDLIEEIARLYGYSNIENDYSFKLDVSGHIDYQDKYINYINSSREYFIGRGFNEIISYSQQDDKKISQFNVKPVLIKNPNSVLMNSMRVNLMYGMVMTVLGNINEMGKDVSLRLFEIGKVFADTGSSFSEESHLCFSVYGKRDTKSYDIKESNFDFLDIKGELGMYLAKLNIENYELIYYNAEGGNGYFDIKSKNSVIGNIWIVNRKVFSDFDVDYEVYVVELILDSVYKLLSGGSKFSEISKFPPAKRDIAILSDKKVTFFELNNVIRESGGSRLKSVNLFDIYSDEKLGNEMKSMTFSLEFGSDEKTLTDDEVNGMIQKIIKNLNKKLGVTLRAN